MADKKGRLELKVGVFLLSSLAVLVAFVLVLGNFRFEPGRVFYVDFSSSGGLREGAKVKVAGVSAGKVKDIEFRAPEAGSDDDVRVRVRVELDEDMARAVTVNSQIFITTEGMLGEKYIEITPGSQAEEPIAENAVMDGEDPVQLQVVTTRIASMVEEVNNLLGQAGGDMAKLLRDTKHIIESAREVAGALSARLPGLMEEGSATMSKVQSSLEHVDGLVTRGKEALAHGDKVLGTGEEVIRSAGALIDEGRQAVNEKDGVREAIQGVSGLIADVRKRVPTLAGSAEGLLENAKGLATEGKGLIADARGFVQATGKKIDRMETEIAGAVQSARRLMSRADSTLKDLDTQPLVEDLRKAIATLVEDISESGKSLNRLSSDASNLVKDLSSLVNKIEKGKGALGAFLNDREIYDDVRELILDLKKNPWKVLYKP